MKSMYRSDFFSVIVDFYCVVLDGNIPSFVSLSRKDAYDHAVELSQRFNNRVELWSCATGSDYRYLVKSWNNA